VGNASASSFVTEDERIEMVRSQGHDARPAVGSSFAVVRARLVVAVRHLLLLAACTVGGVAVTRTLGLVGVERSRAFVLATTLLLAVGLYAATSDIEISAIREDRRLIIRVLTIGVLLKVALIDAALWVLFGDPRMLIFGVVMAQIDPLSVSALVREGRMSPRARRVLEASAAFDDPVTVLLALPDHPEHRRLGCCL
jgi:NhaP-type Na+/H+ or K+/H+ antiporter